MYSTSPPEGRSTSSTLLIVLLAVLLGTCWSITVPVSTDKEFFRALTNSSVDTIVLRKDVHLGLSNNTWDTLDTAYFLSRNVSVTSQPPGLMLDFGSVYRSVRLGPDVWFSFYDLIVKSIRQNPSLVGLDLVDVSDPTSVIYGYNTTIYFFACYPLAPFAFGFTNATRSKAAANGTNLAIPQPTGLCFNRLLDFRSSGLNATNASCITDVVRIVDFAVRTLTVTGPSGGVAQDEGYTTWLKSCYAICEETVTIDCIKRQGLQNCLYELNVFNRKADEDRQAQQLASSASSPPPGPPQLPSGYDQRFPSPDTSPNDDDSGGNSKHLAIILPTTIVGGCAIIALCAYLLYARRQSPGGQGQGQQQQPGAQAEDHETGLARSIGQQPQQQASGGTPMSKALTGPSNNVLYASSGKNPGIGSESLGTGSALHVSSQGGYDPSEDLQLSRLITDDTPLPPALRLDVAMGSEVVLGERIGAGATGTVYRGQYQGQAVAVKVIKAEVAEKWGSFESEVRILGKCDHPNIVRLHAANVSPPQLFLVMELMPGGTLEDLLHGSGKAGAPAEPLPLQTVLRIAHDIATGLAYLHPTVVHRDLKPANIMLDASGRAKISDFGLARLQVVTQYTQSEAGTLSYMAPECFDPDKYAIKDKCDIYSLGMILWELISRQRPWHKVPNAQLMFTICIKRERPQLPEDDERCPPKLRRLIQACWADEPSTRPAAAEVAKQLLLLRRVLQQAPSAPTSQDTSGNDG